jgi:hypothetical protein
MRGAQRDDVGFCVEIYDLHDGRRTARKCFNASVSDPCFGLDAPWCFVQTEDGIRALPASPETGPAPASVKSLWDIRAERSRRITKQHPPDVSWLPFGWEEEGASVVAVSSDGAYANALRGVSADGTANKKYELREYDGVSGALLSVFPLLGGWLSFSHAKNGFAVHYEEHSVSIYARVRPAGTWRHFVRVETWLALIFGALLIGQFVRRMRARKRRTREVRG